MIFNFNGDESAIDEMFKLMITGAIVMFVIFTVFIKFIYPHTEPYKADVRLNNTVKQYQRTHTDEKLTEITSDGSLNIPKNVQKGFYLDDNDDVHVFSK